MLFNPWNQWKNSCWNHDVSYLRCTAELYLDFRKSNQLKLVEISHVMAFLSTRFQSYTSLKQSQSDNQFKETEYVTTNRMEILWDDVGDPQGFVPLTIHHNILSKEGDSAIKRHHLRDSTIIFWELRSPFSAPLALSIFHASLLSQCEKGIL